MKEDLRQRIVAARDLLGLGEKASVNEIRSAYRRLAKQHHPDLGNDKGERVMLALTEAYQLLLDLCNSYPVPLPPEELAPQSDEDWWMDRFGSDPLWSKG